MSVAQELLHRYEKLQTYHANEAETRLKLIDRIVFEILGWSHDDVSVEERVTEDQSTTFADYIIRTAGTSFIIEAKKAGETFSNVPNVRRQRLGTSFVSGSVGQAIIQARDYCRRMSIPFAVVTNGAEWIAYPATRIDQISFSQSSAIIFPSLRSLLGDDRLEFLALLSRDAVVSGSLEVELLGRKEDQFGERRLRNFFSNRGAVPRQNTLYPLIERAVISAFTDSIVDTNPDLLDKCYVNTADRMKFDRQIGMHLSKRAPLFHARAKRPLGKRDADSLKVAIAQADSQVRPLAILIVGSVGAGKTTFLRHTRLVTAADFFEESRAEAYPHWIYIDFRAFLRTQQPSEFIYSSIRKYVVEDWYFSNFEQCIRPAYATRIRAMKEGPLKLIAHDDGEVNAKIAGFLFEQSEKDEYVDTLLLYTTSRVPVFLVIDNVDQFEDEELQASIFSDSVSFAHRTRLNLVLSLRDATYVKHRSTTAFDAFDYNPMYIEPPQIKAVLSRRFFLMKQLLKGQSGSFVSEGGARFELDDLSFIADLISSSVLGSNVGNVIDVLSTSDVRLALRMTREFLESGYSNPGRAIDLYRRKGEYLLPRHEALRSVLLGRQPVYSEEFSVIGNPFDAKLGRTRDQMLRLYLLTAMVTMSSQPSFEYADGPSLRDCLGKLGFGSDTTLAVLRDLCRLRFVHTASHGAATFDANYYPSRLGGYIVRYLMADLTFLEAVLMDTFIAERDLWEELKELSEEVDAERGDLIRRLRLRNDRVIKFYNYCHSLYSEIIEEARRRGLPQEWCEDPFENMQRNLHRNLRKAINSARRNYGRSN